MGVIYLLHFERSYHHARHYLGYTDDLEGRLAAHRAGRGSPLVAAAVRDGIDFELAATWPGDRHHERRLHRYRNSPRRLCPICRADPGTDPRALSHDPAPPPAVTTRAARPPPESTRRGPFPPQVGSPDGLHWGSGQRPPPGGPRPGGSKMAKHRRTLTDEEREQRRAEQRELVRASIEQLRSSDGWQAYLKVRSRFHSYSWRNVLLILHQHPPPNESPGSAPGWSSGYCVTKGSRAIRIWAPCPPTRTPAAGVA